MKTFILLLILIITISFPIEAQAINIYASTTSDNAQFMIIDPNGKKTGYDPVSKTIIAPKGVLSNMEYHGGYISEDPNAPTDNHYQLQGILGIDMTPFTFKLIITGMKLGKEEIVIGLEENEQYAPYPQNHKGDVIHSLLDVGQVSTYEFNYVPLKSLTRVKIATPADLIADITTSCKLGYIGNAKFVNELIKEIQEIERERTEVQKPEEHQQKTQGDKEKEHLTPAQRAVKEYKELSKEITEKYQKPEADEFVKQEAYTVLKEDLDYIIAHIQ